MASISAKTAVWFTQVTRIADISSPPPGSRWRRSRLRHRPCAAQPHRSRSVRAHPQASHRARPSARRTWSWSSIAGITSSPSATMPLLQAAAGPIHPCHKTCSSPYPGNASLSLCLSDLLVQIVASPLPCLLVQMLIRVQGSGLALLGTHLRNDDDHVAGKLPPLANTQTHVNMENTTSFGAV